MHDAYQLEYGDLVVLTFTQPFQWRPIPSKVLFDSIVVGVGQIL